MGTKLALRAGQLAADTEFMTAKYTDVFINASLGWPVGLSLNIYWKSPRDRKSARGKWCWAQTQSPSQKQFLLKQTKW